MRSGALVAAVGLAAAALFAPPRVLALDPHRALTQYVLAVWRMEQGLPHNTVRAVQQTRDGYLWLGTYGGLVRFDGVRFQVFDNRNSALRDNEVRALAEDADGVLWVGTTAGGLHRLVRGRLAPVDDGGIEHRAINALKATRDGVLCVGTSDGLYLLHRDGTRIRVEQHLPHVYVNGVASSGATVWAATASGLFRIADGKAAEARIAGFENNEIWSVLVNSSGRIWVGLTGRVLELRADAADEHVSVAHTFALPDDWAGVRALVEDRNRNVWIGSYGGGLYRLVDERLERFSVEHGFIDHRPWALFEDREGSLWVGTRGGVAQLRDGAAIAFSTQEGLPADVVRAVLEAPDGSVWVGSERGLAKVATGSVRRFDPHVSVTIHCIVRDRLDRIWIGTDGGIREVRVATGQLGPSIKPHRGSPGNSVRNMLVDRAGRTWIGTDRGVVIARDGIERGAFETVSGLEDVGAQNIESLFEDRAGGIWIGTLTTGMRRWSERGVENPTLVSGGSIGVRSFLEDEDGILYVGTIGSGLFVRRPGGAFHRVTTREGLRDDAIWSILQDGDRLWMSSDRGVFRLSRARLLELVDGRTPSVHAERTVGTQDGMKSRECNGGGRPTGFIARDGRIWFPTARGAVAIDPTELQRDPVAAPVAIEEVVIDRRAQPRAATIAIPPASRDIEVNYTGLSFVDPVRMRFRYRLQGYDAGWIEADSRRVAYYASVPPGEYEFRVEAANGDGPWSEPGATIRFDVQPRVTETIWFRGGAVIALVMAAGGWLRLRARRQQARENRLRQTVAERTAELERANQQLAELATRDGLTGITNYRGFQQALDAEWLRAQRGCESLSLLLCDIDEFKAYNDGYGHQAGDTCLVRIARAIADVMRRGQDLAARYGGEEFAVVLPATDADGARVVGASVRDAVARLDLPHAFSNVRSHVTISVGCATVVVDPRGQARPETLVHLADQALYEAKRSGRDRVVSGGGPESLSAGV